ncbi:MAG: DUF6361 family protein [Methanococcaceae archaeon]
MANIGWIDFSPSHREKIGTILELLKPEEMVDELGVGIIRDALANQMFPGISTIQTCAKYFFLIPYILQEYQALKPSQKRNKNLAKFLDDREHEIMWDLGDIYNHELGCGVIGITKKRNQRIMRRPSTIYWNGLHTFDIINTRGLGINQYLSLFEKSSLESQISRVSMGDDTAGDDADAEFDNSFGIKIENDPAWKDQLTLDLTSEEADFLKQKIVDNVKGKLIAELLCNDDLYTEFSNTDSFMDFAKSAVQSSSSSSQLKRVLTIAHDFSQLAFGAHIAYNYLLQKQKYNKSYFQDEWTEWLDNLPGAMLDYNNFNPTILFQPPFAVTARSFTADFIYKFWTAVNRDVISPDDIKSLIVTQESFNKRNKARLRWNKMDDVIEGKWIGLSLLDYRYGRAKRILKDINSGQGANNA